MFCRKFRWACLALFLASWPVTNSDAAKIGLTTVAEFPKQTVITIEGELLSGDEKNFNALALSIDEAVVVLSSPGGNLNAGIQIGKALRLKQFDTIVLNGTSCSSACALAWLGGARRYMEPDARIGFHAAYRTSGGETEESGVGNALAGHYLNQLGLPESAVAYITHAAPESMQWLSPQDAERYGIHVSVLGSADREPDPPPSAPAPSTPTQYVYANGVDLFGYDLRGMPIRNMDKSACESACRNNSSCRAFTFNSKSSTCFLKSGADFAVRYEPANSGYPREMEVEIRLSQLEVLQRTDVIGMDYLNKRGLSLEQCLRECDSSDSCRAFTYVLSKKHCWMKSGVRVLEKRKGMVSGVKR